MANQPMLPKSHTNSADLTSRLPDGRSTKDRVKVARNEQTLKRSAPRAPVLYHRPIGRCFTTSLVKIEPDRLENGNKILSLLSDKHGAQKLTSSTHAALFYLSSCLH